MSLFLDKSYDKTSNREKKLANKKNKWVKHGLLGINRGKISKKKMKKYFNKK